MKCVMCDCEAEKGKNLCHWCAVFETCEHIVRYQFESEELGREFENAYDVMLEDLF